MIREPVKNNLWWLLHNFMFSKFCGQLTVLLDYLRYLFSQSLTFGSLKKCAQSRSVPECFQVKITHLPELEAKQPLGRMEMEQQSCPIDRSPHPLLPLVLTAAAPNLFLS